MSDSNPEIYTCQDRDLLVSINTKLERVIYDVQELRDNFAARLNNVESALINLEKEKVSRMEHDILHEKLAESIRQLENWRWKMIGMLVVLSAIFGIMAPLIMNYLI